MVYFIAAGPFIKIGRSAARSLGKRLAHVQTHCPYAATVLTTIRCNPDFEKKLHQKFERYHFRGEWFVRGRELLDEIDALRQSEDEKDLRLFHKAIG